MDLYLRSPNTEKFSWHYMKGHGQLISLYFVQNYYCEDRQFATLRVNTVQHTTTFELFEAQLLGNKSVV